MSLWVKTTAISMIFWKKWQDISQWVIWRGKELCMWCMCILPHVPWIRFQSRDEHHPYGQQFGEDWHNVSCAHLHASEGTLAVRCVELMKAENYHQGHQFHLLSEHFTLPHCTLPAILGPHRSPNDSTELEFATPAGMHGLEPFPDFTKHRLKATLSSWPIYFHIHSSPSAIVCAKSIQMVRLKKFQFKNVP